MADLKITSRTLEDESSFAFKDILTGANAFYKDPTYETTTRGQLDQKNCLPVTYTVQTESKAGRIAKKVFAGVIFPVGMAIGVYKIFQLIAGKIILPATRTYNASTALELRKNFDLGVGAGWKYKRFTIEVDGKKVDCLVMGKAATLGNGKWILHTNGNNGCYEQVGGSDLPDILEDNGANALLFNYTGVGASQGLLSKDTLAKAYRAALSILEDQEIGIGAKKIIGYGHSLGGVVQGEALKKHALKAGIKYVFIKRGTLTSVAKFASEWITPIMGVFVKVLNLNLEAVTSSRSLAPDEIIMQTGNVEDCKVVNDSSSFIYDDVVPPGAMYAKEIMDKVNEPRGKKVFLAIPEIHDQQLGESSRKALRAQIKKSLKAAK